MTLQNNKYVLAHRPVGVPDDKTFSWKTSDVPELADGEICIKVKMISIDPAMRGWINEGKSYVPPVQIGEVMRAGGVGEVVASKNEKFAVGDHVVGLPGTQEYCVTDGKGFTKVDPALAPINKYLGVLGMPGMTAYFGILEVGQPQAGETVVVSAAAGAVGGLVGQIAKIKGCRVIGIAGGPEKCKKVKAELGFDECIDYKNENVKKSLKELCPDGINVYFDNVGGEILEAALANLAMKARVVVCGAISQYNNTEMGTGPRNYLALLVTRSRMEGMVVFDWAKRYGEAAKQMGQWMMQGKLKAEEHIVEGLETYPQTLQMLFKGENKAKLIIKVAA